jgi:uncharacterized protein
MASPVDTVISMVNPEVSLDTVEFAVMNAAMIYIHGFNSSPASYKAQRLRNELQYRAPATEFFAPALPPSPAVASQLLDGLVRKHPHAALVGSSLGGYYATWLAEKFALRAVLLNPALRPYDLLANEIGPQKNMYTGASYELTVRHLDELRALEVDHPLRGRYLLIVTTGDDVLDYRHAVERYRGATQIVIEGGDHGLSGFADYLDPLFAFVDGDDAPEVHASSVNGPVQIRNTQ